MWEIVANEVSIVLLKCIDRKQKSMNKEKKGLVLNSGTFILLVRRPQSQRFYRKYGCHRSSLITTFKIVDNDGVKNKK